MEIAEHISGGVRVEPEREIQLGEGLGAGGEDGVSRSADSEDFKGIYGHCLLRFEGIVKAGKGKGITVL